MLGGGQNDGGDGERLRFRVRTTGDRDAVRAVGNHGQGVQRTRRAGPVDTLPVRPTVQQAAGGRSQLQVRRGCAQGTGIMFRWEFSTARRNWSPRLCVLFSFTDRFRAIRYYNSIAPTVSFKTVLRARVQTHRMVLSSARSKVSR